MAKKINTVTLGGIAKNVTKVVSLDHSILEALDCKRKVTDENPLPETYTGVLVFAPHREPIHVRW